MNWLTLPRIIAWFLASKASSLHLVSLDGQTIHWDPRTTNTDHPPCLSSPQLSAENSWHRPHRHSEQSLPSSHRGWECQSDYQWILRNLSAVVAIYYSAATGNCRSWCRSQPACQTSSIGPWNHNPPYWWPENCLSWYLYPVDYHFDHRQWWLAFDRKLEDFWGDCYLDRLFDRIASSDLVIAFRAIVLSDYYWWIIFR